MIDVLMFWDGCSNYYEMEAVYSFTLMAKNITFLSRIAKIIWIFLDSSEKSQSESILEIM